MNVDFKFIMNATSMFSNVSLDEAIKNEMEYQLYDVTGFADFLLDDLDVSQDYYDTILDNMDTFMSYVKYDADGLEVDYMDWDSGDAIITYRIPLDIQFDRFASDFGVSIKR